MKLFLTGGTGFLGKYILRNLIDSFDVIYVLSRKDLPEEFSKNKKIIYVKGDITNLKIIESNELQKEIIESVTHVIHAAAFYDLTASHKICFENNVLGTKNVINLVKKLKKLERVSYISTIAVAGENCEVLKEEALVKMPRFKDHYSSTKFLAEKLIIEELSNITNLNIIRPGIIIGDSLTGYVEKIDGPYYFLELYKKLKFLRHSNFILPLSYNPKTLIPIIPVDHCARLISKLQFIKLEKQTNYFNLISHEIPSVDQLLDDLNRRFELTIKYIPVQKNFIHQIILKKLGIPKEVIPFMFSEITYDKSVTYKLLPEIIESKYSQFKESLLK